MNIIQKTFRDRAMYWLWKEWGNDSPMVLKLTHKDLSEIFNLNLSMVYRIIKREETKGRVLTKK